MAETTFKYQAKKLFQDGSFVQINTGEKSEFDDFLKDYLDLIGNTDHQEMKEAVEEAKATPEPPQPTQTATPPLVCEICGTPKVRSTFNGQPWWKCPNFKNHGR